MNLEVGRDGLEERVLGIEELCLILKNLKTLILLGHIILTNWPIGQNHSEEQEENIHITHRNLK